MPVFACVCVHVNPRTPMSDDKSVGLYPLCSGGVITSFHYAVWLLINYILLYVILKCLAEVT